MEEVRWPGWFEIGRGRWIKVPPRRCPACASAWGTVRDRPLERFVRCGCSESWWHTLWTCPVCGALAAEGCADVGRWQNPTTPIGADPAQRWAVQSRVDG